MDIEVAILNIQKFSEKFARDEIICIRENRDKAIPRLMEFIASATAAHKAADKWHEDLEYHIYAMHLLAEFKVQESFPLFVEILELDNYTCGSILGDTLTEGMGSLIGTVAEKDDIERIKTIIENEELDSFQRGAALNALIVMNYRSVYERSELIDYLGYLLNKYSDDSEFVSITISHCYDVSARSHYPRILELFEEGCVETFLMGEQDFEIASDIPEEEEALKNAEESAYLRPITDTIESMGWWGCFKDKERDKMRALANKEFWDNDPMVKAFEKASVKRKARAELASKTEYNATPIVKEDKIGRNEPCPCGSGKKYKKCCIASQF